MGGKDDGNEGDENDNRGNDEGIRMMLFRGNVREFWFVIFSHATTLPPALPTLNEHDEEGVG